MRQKASFLVTFMDDEHDMINENKFSMFDGEHKNSHFDGNRSEEA